LDSARRQLGVGSVRVVDDELKSLHRARFAAAHPAADRDRARRSGRRELHEAHLVAHAVVVVRVEPGLLGVERLRRVHVGAWDAHDRRRRRRTAGNGAQRPRPRPWAGACLALAGLVLSLLALAPAAQAAPFVTVRVTIDKVSAIDCFEGTVPITGGCTGAADFYPVVNIDGHEQTAKPIVDENTADPDPDWVFDQTVDVTKG